MQTILTVVHLFLALGLIGLILIQHGRGADAGAAFGSGASATVFGARGSGSFLSRTTAILAALFFVTSVVMAYYAQKVEAPKGLMDGAEDTVRIEVPPVPPMAVPTAPVAAPSAASGDVPQIGLATDAAAPVKAVEAQGPAAGDVPVIPAGGPNPVPAGAPEGGAKAQP